MKDNKPTARVCVNLSAREFERLQSMSQEFSLMQKSETVASNKTIIPEIEIETYKARINELESQRYEMMLEIRKLQFRI